MQVYHPICCDDVSTWDTTCNTVFFVWTASQDTYDYDGDDDDDDDDVDDHTSNPSWQAVEFFASHPSL